MLAAGLLFLTLANCNKSANQTTTAGAAPKQQFLESVPNTSFTLEAASNKVSRFSVPEGATEAGVNGGFSASGNIGVSILNEEEFGKWRNGQPARKLYNSDSASRGDINVSLPEPGTYFAIFQNKFSPFSLYVDAHVNVHYAK